MTLQTEIGKIINEPIKDNANIRNTPSAKMLQIASAASKDYYLKHMIPEHIATAHREGKIHIHDLEWYAKTLTCVQIPLGEVLSRGFNTGHGYIRPPKRPTTASALAAIILQSCQNDMHGGQSFGFFDRDMAPFFTDAKEFECYQAMEALIYNFNSMHSRAGSQVPFSSLNLGCDTTEAGRRVTRNILAAYDAGLGNGEQAIWPNIIFRVKEGVNLNPGDPNYDLFKQALEVAGHRMNPTFSFMDSSFNAPFGDEVGYMGCRTRVIANVCGPEVTSGRGNISFTTLNLPGIALEATHNGLDFFSTLDSYIEIGIEQMLHRWEIQAKLKVKDMPFLMGQGIYLDSEKLNPDDEIREAAKHGTLSLGFCGLAECLKVLTDETHDESEESNILGHKIISTLRDWLNVATVDYGLNFTLLATPAESTAGRFCNIDKEKYGIIEGVTDRGYYTNSFHVPVHHQVDSYTKIHIEGAYHKYCNAGHISYVEFSSAIPKFNTMALESIVREMKNADMGYAGFNFPIDECMDCHYKQGIFTTCPICGSKHVRRIRRITGYLSTTDLFNDSKLLELKDRRTHGR